LYPEKEKEKAHYSPVVQGLKVGHLSAFSKTGPEACPYIDHIACRVPNPAPRSPGAK